MKSSVYMTWAKRHAAARYNLAGSGILGCSPQDLRLRPEDILLNGDNADGLPALRAAIAAKYGASPDQVVLGQGTSGANFLACATLLEPGDEVLVEQPVYEPLLALARTLGATVKRFARRFENGYRIEPESIRRSISRRTKLLVLTSPHNPSGVVAEPAVLSEVADLAAGVGARVLLDEVYRDILFEDAPPSGLHLGPQFIATNSLTKSYGLSGLRGGWALCDAELAERMRRMNDLMGAVGPMPTEALSLQAFRNLSHLESRSRALIEPNARLVHDFLRSHAAAIECVIPPRSLTVFPRLKHATSCDLLHDRLRERQTSIVPGRFFEEPRHFRLGFGVQTADVAEGLRHLSELLREHS